MAPSFHLYLVQIPPLSIRPMSVYWTLHWDVRQALYPDLQNPAGLTPLSGFFCLWFCAPKVSTSLSSWKMPSFLSPLNFYAFSACNILLSNSFLANSYVFLSSLDITSSEKISCSLPALRQVWIKGLYYISAPYIFYYIFWGFLHYNNFLIVPYYQTVKSVKTLLFLFWA